MKSEIEEYFDRLWPITRSLTGNSNRESLKTLSELIDLEITEVPSGTQCFDWKRLKQDLNKAGLLSTVSKGSIDLAIYLSATDLTSFWLEKLEADLFYLLDKTSRSWVEPMIDQLGRRLEISDFEGKQND